MNAQSLETFAALIGPTLAVVATASLVSTAIGVLLERLLHDRLRIWDVDLRPGQLRLEILSYARFVVLLSVCATIWQQLDLIRFGAEGAASAAVTFAFLWTSFEIYYYGLHRALHSRPLYRFHAHHHESHVTTSWTGQSLGWVEGLGWMAGLLIPPVLLGLITPVSLTGTLIYFCANTFVNVVGHANVELNPLSARAVTWLSHPWIYHALHHARFKNHYSFASTFMDRLFGTEWSDWPELHRRVFAGEVLTQLNVRGARSR